MDNLRKLRPVGRLLAALEEENIRFMLIGMSAAIVQGVLGTTADIDLWIDLPSRQYMRVQNIAGRLGATMAANTVAFLEDGTPINFVFKVTGLGSFASELVNTRLMTFQGRRIPVLRLQRIQKSKEAVRREKDLLHIVHIKNFLRCQRAATRKR